jgi:SAM-dependent methyltransferase
MKSKIFFGLTNNIVVNNILIRLGLDGMFASKFGIYKRVVLDETLTPREMAGFTANPEIEAALDTIHAKLGRTVQNHLKKGDALLDIGCGPGTYLKDFENDFKITGIDLNLQMINKARENLKGVELIHHDFITHKFTKKYNCIYSISVLEFIPPGQLRTFFRKAHTILEDDGIIFFLYPHALRLKDVMYPDLYYIEYSPRRIESAIRNLFETISHKHAFDERQVDLYDKHPYHPGERVFKNGYLLIARKKASPKV